MTTLVEAVGLALPGRLEPLSLDLREGELACLIGPNGSGKTSLLHALAGIGHPTGEVRIAGEALARVPPARRFRLLSFMPASRDIAWPVAAGDLVRLGGAEASEAERMIDALDLQGIAGRPASSLSTGERTRVLLARALAPSPALLLLDEPLANLDPLWQLRLAELLSAETRRSGHAGLIAMHDLDMAGAVADRVIVMKSGRIAADGPAADSMSGATIGDVFGVERRGGRWAAVRPLADPRSSP